MLLYNVLGRRMGWGGGWVHLQDEKYTATPVLERPCEGTEWAVSVFPYVNVLRKHALTIEVDEFVWFNLNHDSAHDCCKCSCEVWNV